MFRLNKKLVLMTTLSVFAFTSMALAQATAYINQVGYQTNDVKSLTLTGATGDPVEFVNSSGTTVLSVTPSNESNYAAGGVNARLVDFSELKVPGTYQVKQNGNVLRQDLKIADKAHEAVLKAGIKWYYFQRASMELTEQYAGQYKRAAGHMDNNVSFHSSATGGSGTLNSPKGWYDAGDYGKYIVNSGITTYTLLALYEHFPQYFNTLKWTIPAEGSLPDLLAEIKYNLDWMLTMQASDGGVYHKLTTLQFSGDIMPNEDTDTRYVIGKGTAATFDFAAVMAVAARVYNTANPSFAAQCLDAAKKAYAWGVQHPNVPFKNPTGVGTGEYGDNSFGDEKSFAAAELFVTTGDASYKLSGASANVPNWGDVGGLATYEKAIHQTHFGTEGVDSLLKMANILENRTNSGFGVAMDSKDFVWGSNAVAGNQGVWLLHAYYMTGDEKYYTAAVKVLDYLLGKNPLNMSFVTGYGTKTAKNPHHRPSTDDGIYEPVPGMVVGGPHTGGEDVGSETWQCSDYRTGKPATSYTDSHCSYATNEVAINWNAPFVYLAGAIEAINAGFKPDFAVFNSKNSLPQVRGFAAQPSSGPKLIFDGHRLLMKHNGKEYNLKGVQ